MDGIVPQIKAAVKTAAEDIEHLFKDIVKYFEDGTKEFSVMDVLEIIARDAAVLFIDIMKSILTSS
jgi:DNA topoisomerase VI subunit B